MADYLGNIKGPEGTPGPIGPQGPAGADGTVSFDELTPEQHNSLVGPQGPKGDTGDAGSDGEPGFSPTVQITEIENGTNVVITDFDGPKTFDVMNGESGIEGPKGDTGKQGPKGDYGEQGPKGDTGNDNLNIYYETKLKENYKINFLSHHASNLDLPDFSSLNKIQIIDDNNEVVAASILNGIGGITYVTAAEGKPQYTEVLKADRFCTTEPIDTHFSLVDAMNNNTLVFNENKIVCGEHRGVQGDKYTTNFSSATFTSTTKDPHYGNGFKGIIRRFPLIEIDSDFIYNGETYKTNFTTLRNYIYGWTNHLEINFILDLVHTDESGIIDKMITCSFHYDGGIRFMFDSSVHTGNLYSATITITKI